MAESIQTPDGTPVDLDAAEREFARAMAAPPADDLAAPPKRDPAAAADPEKSGKSTRTKAAPKPRVKKATPVKSDYTEDAQTVVSSVWTVTAAIPPTQAFAYVINANANNLTAALAEGAKHSETIRNALTGGGEHAWKAQLGIVAVSMAMQTMQLLKDPELRQQAAEHTRAQLQEIVKSAEVPADGGDASPE